MSESSHEVEMKSEKRKKKKKKHYESNNEDDEPKTEKRKKKKKKKHHSESNNNEDDEIRTEKRKKKKHLPQSRNDEEETKTEKRKKKEKKHSESNNNEEEETRTPEKRKKKKDLSELNSGEEETKTEKRKKKRKHSESIEVESKREKSKKALRVETSVLTDAPDRIAPIVGYFSSGYNANDWMEQPEVKLFRNKKHRSSQLEVVVKPPDSNVEFVGKSYEGEAAVHQPCQYALGILDKDTQTLKVVQIAGNKIFRLEPQVMKRVSAEETPEKQGEEVVNAQSVRKISDLTSLYGTKKQRAMDKKLRLLQQQTNDPSAREQLEAQMFDDETKDKEVKDTKATSYQNIPPHDLSAVTQEKAYLLDEIIPKPEREYLYDILGFLQSGFGDSPTFWEENYYPSFVRNRIHWLKSMQDGEEKMKQAFTLSYITHLVNFYKLMGSRFAHEKPHQNYGDAINKYKIPRVIFQKFSNLFLDPASNALSSEKRELIIGYILVLTLFADKFSTDSFDIAKDLGMALADLRVYFRQLGSKNSRDSTTGKFLWTLPVPLKISVLPPSRRKRK